MAGIRRRWLNRDSKIILAVFKSLLINSLDLFKYTGSYKNFFGLFKRVNIQDMIGRDKKEVKVSSHPNNSYKNEA